MNIKRSIAVLILVAVGVLIYTLRAPGLSPVVVANPTREAISATLTLTGKVVNDRVVKLTALTDGRLMSTLAAKGEHVDAGDVIAVFDRIEADAEYQKALAELERGETSVKVNLAKLKRVGKLKESAGSSEQSLEEAEAEHKYALAQLKVAQANLQLAEIKRSHTELTTPYSGTVIEKTSEAGQWMEAGTHLYSLVADEGFEIEAQVDASDINKIHIDQPVDISSDADPGKPWRSTIRWIAPAITEDDKNNSSDIAVRLPLGNDAPLLRLNQQVDITVTTDFKEDALVIPLDAIIDEGDGESRVMVVEDGVVNTLAIATGIENVAFVEIVNGLGEDAQVVLTNQRALSSGQKVETRLRADR